MPPACWCVLRRYAASLNQAAVKGICSMPFKHGSCTAFFRRTEVHMLAVLCDERAMRCIAVISKHHPLGWLLMETLIVFWFLSGLGDLCVFLTNINVLFLQQHIVLALQKHNVL